MTNENSPEFGGVREVTPPVSVPFVRMRASKQPGWGVRFSAGPPEKSTQTLRLDPRKSISMSPPAPEKMLGVRPPASLRSIYGPRPSLEIRSPRASSNVTVTENAVCCACDGTLSAMHIANASEHRERIDVMY